MLDIDVNSQELEKALSQLDSNLKVTSSLMRRIAGALKTRTDMNIRQGISADGGPFKELAEPTIKQRTKKNKWPGRILQVENLLNRSVTTDSGKEYAAIGSNLPGARRQQLGDIKPDKRGVELPARPYMPVQADGELQKDVVPILLEMTLKHLEGGL